MYNKISQKITKMLTRLKIVKNDEFEIYKYGFELIFAFSFTILVILSISLLLNMFIETILYLSGFFVVRIICGGYHAKHHYSCFLLTISSYILFLIVYCFFEQKIYSNSITIPLTIFSAVQIVLFAPIEHHNNPMTKQRKSKNRLLSIALSIIIFLLSIASLLFESDFLYNLPFCIGIVFAVIAILAAKIEIAILKRKEEQQ